MEQLRQRRESSRRRSVGYVAATLAIGGLSATVLAIGTAGATTNRTAKTIVISTVKDNKLGTLLVSGKTLYTLKANKNACTAKCLQTWPEVLLPTSVTKATAGTGVSASKLGTVKRAGGALQVTYAGKALYWFSGDTGAGQVHGNVNDTWGTWSDVVLAKPGSSNSSGGSGAGSGGNTGGNTGTGGVAF